MITPKHDPNLVFASSASDEDTPAFSGYDVGWGVSRENNGKPTIKQFNFLQKTTDEKIKWLHEHGACLPFDDSITYASGAIVLKNGVLEQFNGSSWERYVTSDKNVKAWTGAEQEQENKTFITSCYDIQALKNIAVTQDRMCQVTKDSIAGLYKYEASSEETADEFNVVTSQNGSGRWIRKNITVDTNKNLYKKRLIVDLPFRFPLFYTVSAPFKQYNCFPQGFTFEPENNLIYLAVQSNKVTSIVVWDISDKNNPINLTAFKLDYLDYTQEGLGVRWEDGKRYLYVRNQKGFLAKYDITSMPQTGAIINIADFTQTLVSTNRNFNLFGDMALVGGNANPIGNFGSRGSYAIYNKELNCINTVNLDGGTAGAIEGSPLEGLLPKIQGMAMVADGFIGSSGGATSSNSPMYTNVGTIKWGSNGELLHTNLISNQGIYDYVTNVLGRTPAYCETEGVYSDSSGRIYTLVLYLNEKNQAGADKGGILIFEEYSDSVDAYDFSKYAIVPALPKSNQVNGNLYPITNFVNANGNVQNAYRNPYNNFAFSSWKDICAYMISAEVSKFSYYANSGASLKPSDFLGNTVPTSYGLIDIYNCNNNTFLIQATNPNGLQHTFTVDYAKNTQVSQSALFGDNTILERTEPMHTINYSDGSTVTRSARFTISPSGNVGLWDVTKNTWIICLDKDGKILVGSEARFGGHVFSNADNRDSCGLLSRRWTTVYASTGTINTSDAREKTPMRSVNDAEIAVAKQIMQGAGFFKFNEAIEKKGDNDARWHYGVMAQDVIKAFTDNGLDWQKYAMICYDEWDSVDAEYDDEGNCISEAIKAGNRYGVRLDQLTFFCLSHLLS